MNLQYYGILSMPHSWGCVASEILLQLKQKGIKFKCTSTNSYDSIHPGLKNNLVQPEVYSRGGVRQVRLRPPKTAISLSYTIPKNLQNIPARYKAAIYNYETTVMPKPWVQLMNRDANLILPSSNFSKDIFANNGVNEEKMVVLPHGYDPSIYHPEVEPIKIKGLSDDKFKFLTVAISHWRKGYDVLLKAYVEEFKNDDSVVLIIKTGLDPREAKGKQHIDVRQIIEDLKREHTGFKWPEIRMINTKFDNLARLYNRANAVVLPTRTECFSLTMLEASGCKRPVITTNYGGHLDFLNKDNSYLIDYKMRKAPQEGQYWGFNPDAELAEPDVDHLRSLMREVKDNYQQAENKAELAYQSVKDTYTWESVADQLVELMNQRGWPL